MVDRCARRVRPRCQSLYLAVAKLAHPAVALEDVPAADTIEQQAVEIGIAVMAAGSLAARPQRIAIPIPALIMPVAHSPPGGNSVAPSNVAGHLRLRRGFPVWSAVPAPSLIVPLTVPAA